VHPPTVMPPCNRASMSRIMRVSWILMPGKLRGSYRDRQSQPLQKRELDVNVQALRMKGGKAVGDRNFSRTAARWSKPFFSLKSDRLLEQISLRKNVENFSYCFTKACLK